jgi:hypothetical protein
MSDAAQRRGPDGWAQSKGEGRLRKHRLQKNAHSIDGLPTGLTEAEEVMAEEAGLSK